MSAAVVAYRRLLAGLLAWLDGAPADPPWADWTAADWALAPQAALYQGIAPYLFARRLPDAPPGVPAAFAGWLAAEYAMNARRLARLHAELQAILAAAARLGIPVAPLKGALLSTQVYPHPALRPMADLDLLIQPADFTGLAQVLARLGYRRQPAKTPYDSQVRFVDPGGGRVVSRTGEHPDNPRPVEVHTHLRRTPWRDLGGAEFTRRLWQGARPGALLGEPALLLDPHHLLQHLALHAGQHFLVDSAGRLIQWLDLALLARQLPHLTPLADEPLAAPHLHLARRALPHHFHGLTLPEFSRTPRRLLAWSQSVPLDERCGLVSGLAPEDRPALAHAWRRWSPQAARLALEYGDVPLPLAALRHLGVTLAYARRLAGYQHTSQGVSK